VDAERMIGEFGVRDRVTLVEGNSPDRWRSLAARSDLALHLSSNPHCRLSPYLELSMAAAVPTVAMRVGRGETIPENVAFSLEPGLHETAQLVGVFDAVGSGDSRQLGQAGKNLVSQENDPTSVAARLATTFRESAPLLADVMRAWDGLYTRAEDALLEEIRALVDVPTGGMPGAYEMIVKPFVEEMRAGAKASRS
jgi:hypothetical protein